MTDATAELVEAGSKYLYPNYRQPALVMAHGRGCELFDEAGKRYLDLYAGIAVSTLGHAHPVLTRAISEQAGALIHLSNYYYNGPNVRLATRLCALTGLDRAFFCSSGTEAVEALLKLARRHFFAQGKKDRVRVIAFESSFHGRTLGALAATGQPAYREGFGPLSPTTHVPFGDLEAVKGALGDDVAAILVEPVQGEGGVLPAPPGFLEGLRELADASSALLLFDEVQTGVGRTGHFLGCQSYGVKPDAIALAKALGGGVPIGAMLTTTALEEALPPGTHGSTFGGSPLACAAALAVLDVIESEGLMQRAVELGDHLHGRLQQLAAKYPEHVATARGVGLLRALVLRDSVDARAVLGQIRERGVLLTIAGGKALRFSPPLIVSQAQLDEGVDAVDAVLGGLN